jgi:DNA-binding transcriptional LysR family regulator
LHECGLGYPRGIVDWDDLKFLLAVADAGALAPAARSLRVDPSTVSRRIGALEKALQAELVVRTPEGMSLTDAGRSVVGVARRFDAELVALAASMGGERGDPVGNVKVSTTDAFAPNVMRALAPLRGRFPRLHIEVMPAHDPVDLRRREADLAVRLFRDEHDGLALRRLGAIGWSLFATPAYLAGHPRGAGLLDGHVVVGYSDQVRGIPGAAWLLAHAAPEAIGIRCGSPRAAIEAALSDVGVCIVPCYLAAAHAPLVRLTDQVLATSETYAAFLPERRGEARLRVVIDALVEMFERDRAALSGAVL